MYFGLYRYVKTVPQITYTNKADLLLNATMTIKPIMIVVALINLSTGFFESRKREKNRGSHDGKLL